MVDFHEKGFAYVELFDPQIALDAWDDIDQYELHRIVDDKSGKPWKILTAPRTAKFDAFVQEIDKLQNMPQCWERYGKKSMNTKMTEQYLGLFSFSQEVVVKQSIKERIWIWVPLIPISRNQGLPTFIEGSHRHTEDKEDRPYNPVIKPGHALMFDARLRTNIPRTGGGVIFARAYDVANIQLT